jgi:hypothetical protein
MATLRELIIASTHGSREIYALPNADGTFNPDSPARWGRREFENGGVLDDMVFFAAGSSLSDEMLEEAVAGFEAEAADFIIERRNERLRELGE